MKRFCAMLVCVTLLFSFAGCAKSPQAGLTKGQQVRLDDLFDAAMEEQGVQWDHTPRYIPNIFVENEEFRFKISVDQMNTKKSIQLDLASRELGTFSINDYHFRNNFCSVFYGISEEETNSFKDVDGVQKYVKNDTEWYFASLHYLESGLNINLMFLIDEDIACFAMVDLPNETELTDELAYRIMDDFSCVSF